MQPNLPVFDVVREERPLRVVVVGAGPMGTRWVRGVGRHADLELVGIADADERRARTVAAGSHRDDLPVATDVAGLQGVDADICVNATPPWAHFEVILWALERGMAVLTEKPFAATLPQAVKLTAVARASRCLLMISQPLRYDRHVASLRDAAAMLGPLSMVSTEFGLSHRPAGFRARMEQPLLLDMAVHAFDAARHLTGAQPVAAYCDAYNPAWSDYQGAAEAAAVFEMTQGIRYVYTGSWCSRGMSTSWSGRWRIRGEHGSAEWDGDGEPTVAHVADRESPVDGTVGETAAAADDASLALVAHPLDDFVRALRHGTPPWGECSDNVYSLAMAEAAIHSARSGQRILVDDLLARAWHEASRQPFAGRHRS
jgi:predicted dehydrogenase